MLRQALPATFDPEIKEYQSCTATGELSVGG
jgi:hypothetical protein